MPFHICGDEILAIMLFFPFIGAVYYRLRGWYYLYIKGVKPPAKDNCQGEHNHNH